MTVLDRFDTIKMSDVASKSEVAKDGVTKEMGMSNSQWKDYLRKYYDDLEELKEFQEKGQTESFDKKISRMLKRIREVLEV